MAGNRNSSRNLPGIYPTAFPQLFHSFSTAFQQLFYSFSTAFPQLFYSFSTAFPQLFRRFISIKLLLSKEHFKNS